MLLICSAIASFVVLAWKLSNWLWFRPKKLEKLLRQQGYRGNPYKFLIGDYREMSRLYKEAYSKPMDFSDDIATRIIPPHLNCVQKYGKKSFLWFGPTPSVILMEPDLIKEVANKIYQFPKPHSNPLAAYLARGVVFYEGEKWAKHRSLLNPAFQTQQLKLMLPAFYESVSETLHKWEKTDSGEVDIWPDLEAMTGDVISRAAFGSNYKEGRRVFELQREQVHLYVEAMRSLYFPGLRFLPTKSNRRRKQASKEAERLILDIINARRKSMKYGEWNGKDMLGILLQTNAEDNSSLTMQEVVEECKLFYFAGQDTTSSLLLWTMVLLCKFPHWQSRAREEVLQILGSNSDMPDFDKLNQLKIVTMILYEVLRFYSPTYLMRTTVKETVLGDLILPAGVDLYLPIILMHHDLAIWGDDVKEFKPERFADGVLSAMKGKGLFFPFGWGPRICQGQHFAMVEAKLAMAMILRRFSFELSPSYVHAPYVAITMKPQHGAQFIFHHL